MGTVSTNEFRKKLKVIMDGQPWMIIENDFIKPGKGQAFNRVKLKNMITGRVLDRTFKSGETIETADVTTTTMQFLYTDGTAYTFMDTETFDQIEIQKEQLGDDVKWLKESVECEVSLWNNQVISVSPPTFMEFEITYTEPAVKGDTATNVTKKATIDTGYEVDVPLFVNIGDKIKIDTRTGDYLGRV
ncbi:elongation factor P [Chitinispirillales bacterium ANBcel5]|uniref:elongation factor P n=1 Tax=Cellulosispirillum alkaliphilum TaxID=3039283 RepID=UPI002A5774B5|nr:elongation factor P [Chitinispirillales bacterium ANBcel5]